jgi:dihydrofolate reductase
MDAAFDEHNSERLQAADVLLFGANTFKLFEDFWPGVENDRAAPPILRRIAQLNKAIAKIVISDSFESPRAGPWSASTRVVRRGDARSVVARLKAEASEKDLLLFGCRTLWHHLLEADLVDELHVMIGAAILGAGTPAFVRPPQTRLELLGVRTFRDSNNVLLRYAVSRLDR